MSLIPITKIGNLKDYEQWFRLLVFVNFAGKNLCREILHEKEKLPRDGAKLYDCLKHYNNKMQFQIHEEVLYPPNKITDVSKFDLYIYLMVIGVMFGDKYKIFLDDVRTMRNEIFLMEELTRYALYFEEQWYQACNIFNKYGFNTELIRDLQTCDLFAVEQYQGISDSLSFS